LAHVFVFVLRTCKGSGKKSLIDSAAASTVPSSAALTPSVPVVTMVRARGGNQLLINFTPVCANGQYTKDAKKVIATLPFFLLSCDYSDLRVVLADVCVVRVSCVWVWCV
jgi:hypothetical protein